MMSVATEESVHLEAVPESSVWQGALDLIKSRTGRWQYGRRLTLSHKDYIEPRQFCDALLAEALADRRFLRASERVAFFDWACAQSGIKVLVPVLAGHDMLARGDTGHATTYLNLALALDQEDLYAQEMWLAARGTPVTPVDPDKRFCPNPFTRLESASRGRLMFCCPAWLPVPAGALDDATAEDIWNSPAAQDIRASIHDGSYRYCSRIHCPMFTDDKLPRVSSIRDPALANVIKTRAVKLAPDIHRLNLSHDRSCNISCPSCRKKTIMAGRAETERLEQLTERSLSHLVQASRRVTVTGSGDPFASKHYRSVLRKMTSMENGPIVDLQTNGLLIMRYWDELGLEGHTGNVLVSTDAARKETYEIVRRGGLWEDLLENLAFLSTLRKRGSVQSVRLDFVTQALNFREMPAAAELMRSFGFDSIKFQMLRSWNTWSAAEFASHHVGHPGHPEHDELKSVMQDPALAGPDVRWSGFYALASYARRSA
jgi:pyruvate-formate lyase-activating enzyme